MKTEKEKMISGEYYLANDPELVKERADCKRLLKQLNVDEYVVGDGTKAVLAKLIPNAPSSLYIEPPFHCDYGYNITCGENVYFNVNCVVLDVMPVKIGNNVFCASAVQIYTATHPLEADQRRVLENAKPVVIGDDCWIGGGAIICPGVTIGDRCVIGAGSVITKGIPSDSLAVGTPARVIRKIDNK
ncbi:sugar O-acetyltransferase [Mucilaginibacter myungsuensis]|uniref:Nodulation protein L n=1 Tax=Mucilaginibacter myungsuensis TaxID=649104 RepID=A0A929PYJ8_9SPHI|nr:sugar O-acetyltransferase [Mucilaginibacter myungsuensis]MBE9664356.1 sugar O-acetyltransferase [Mucilaginibacter myungsuensis]MDN3597066.1 sugar O-acetyltransferase [Mucilaginibacter myungsuensis]